MDHPADPSFHMDKNDSDEKIRNSAQFLQIAGNTRGISDIRSLEECETPVYKIFIFAEDVELLEKLSDELKENPELQWLFFYIIRRLQAVEPQKGPVLKEYIESLGYTMDEVMVLGDSFNDYSMLSMDFGATVAMENAVPGSKRQQNISQSNNEFEWPMLSIRFLNAKYRISPFEKVFSPLEKRHIYYNVIRCKKQSGMRSRLYKKHRQERNHDGKMKNVYIMDHPLIKHKISMLRDKNTGTNEFP